MNKPSKIYQLSSTMSRFCLLLMIIIPSYISWFWFTFEQHTHDLSIARPSVLIDMQFIQTYQLVIAWIYSLLVAGVLIYGLFKLRKLFQLFLTGTFFSDEAANHLHIFGLMLFVTALLKPLTSAVLSLLLTMGNPVGEMSLIVEFGSTELFTIFIAGTFMAITWILREGNRLAKENAEFV